MSPAGRKCSDRKSGHLTISSLEGVPKKSTLHQESVSLNERHLSSSTGNIVFANKQYVEVIDLSHPKKIICSDHDEKSKGKEKLRGTPVMVITEEEPQRKSTNKRLPKITKKGICNVCPITCIHNMIYVSFSREIKKEEEKIRETS